MLFIKNFHAFGVWPGNRGKQMIFITLGSQKFQFNRLLKAVDSLVQENIIQEEVFAQSGYSDYQPVHYQFQKFLDRDQYILLEERADIIITHGGTGAIIGAVKKGKKVIAVPRMAKYGEHVDDHQFQIVKQFAEMNLICACLDCAYLAEALLKIQEIKYNVYISNTKTYIEKIDAFLEEINREEKFGKRSRLKSNRQKNNENVGKT